MITYSRRFLWHPAPSTRVELNFGPYETKARCDQDSFSRAKKVGWTPPHWWQWWRWNDQPRKEPDHLLSPNPAQTDIAEQR